MTHSRGLRTAFVLRRMRHTRLLLACVLAAVVVITTVVATLADFSARALPAAAARQLETSSDTTIAISGTASPSQARAAGALIAGSLRAALGGLPDRLLAAQWSGPLSLPAPAGSGTIRTAEAAALDGIASQARLVAGRWPGAPRPGQAAGVAIPAADAGPLGLRLGQHLSLTDSDTGRPVALVVTGLYRAADPAAPYWRLDLLPASGESTVPGFQTYGPFIAAAGGFGSGRLTAGQQSWLAEPDVAAIGARQLPGLAARLQGMVSRLRQAPNVGGLQVSTGLPQLLAGTATSYEVARSLLAMSAVELLLVAAAVLALAAALLASQRAEESALLTARGLTRRQLALLALAEAALLLGVAVAAGAALGYWLARPLSASGPLRGSLGGAGAAAWWPAIVVLVLSVVILAWPAAVPGGAGGLLARGRRQPALALASRAGADLAVLALAVVSGWQLRRYSVVARSASGSIGIDPVLIVAPALILIGAALIPLRLMPSLARLGDRISARGHRLVAALATWEISRRPVRQAGPALLAILAVGTGVLALAQQQSWHESVLAQAAAAAGADVRVTVQPPAMLPRAASVLSAPGVQAAMPVSQFNGGLGGSVLAIDAATAARVVLLRSDQAQRPAAALWRLITPAGPAPGVAVPGRPARLTLTTRLSGPLPGAAAVSVTVLAADGVAYALRRARCRPTAGPACSPPSCPRPRRPAPRSGWPGSRFPISCRRCRRRPAGARLPRERSNIRLRSTPPARPPSR
jgi:hypothetical protein